ncbi:hypothetical protein T05_8729, partial [Trichinella murrelli]
LSKNQNKLPVVYDYQPKAWMTRDFSPLLWDIYSSPKVKKSGKMLLISDTAPCHPSCELLDHENGFSKLTFLPSNTSNCYSKFKKAI